jgi:hypothetical protein
VGLTVWPLGGLEVNIGGRLQNDLYPNTKSRQLQVEAARTDVFGDSALLSLLLYFDHIRFFVEELQVSALEKANVDFPRLGAFGQKDLIENSTAEPLCIASMSV